MWTEDSETFKWRERRRRSEITSLTAIIGFLGDARDRISESYPISCRVAVLAEIWTHQIVWAFQCHSLGPDRAHTSAIIVNATAPRKFIGIERGTTGKIGGGRTLLCIAAAHRRLFGIIGITRLE